MIREIYMTGRIDDYVVDFMHPNLHIVLESVVMSYQMCMNTGVICGGGDTRYVMIMDLIVIWCIVIPLSFASAFLWNASPVVPWVLCLAPTLGALCSIQ